MWWNIFKFELSYRRKRPATYIYFFILFFTAFMAISTDTVQIGGGAGLVKENSPVTISTMMVILSAFCMMITSGVMGVAVLRDYEHQMDSVMFVNPITKGDYLIGRFLGSFVTLLFVFSGFFFGFIVGEFMWWRDVDKLLPFSFINYLQPFLVFVVPNLFFTGVLFFVVGALSRKMMAVYVQWIALFAFYQVALILTSEIDNRDLAAILDPFAIRTINVVTQYWTVAEQNSQLIPLEGVVLTNRLVWIIFGVVTLVVGYFGFSFNVVRSSLFKKKTIKNIEVSNATVTVPEATQRLGLKTYILQILKQSGFYYKQVLRGLPFIIIMAFGMFIFIINTFFMGRVFGINTYPTTYLMLELIGAIFGFFLVIVIVFYSGELVWKERDVKMNLIHDAMPIPDFVGLASKFLGMVWMLTTVLLTLIFTAVVIQTFKGYFVYEFAVYFKVLFTETFFFMLLFTLLAFFIHVMVNQKFIGHAAIILFFIVTLVLSNWGLEHSLFQFGSADLGTYSDMNGFGHFVPGFSWFNVYWFGFAILLFAVAVVFAARGSESIMRVRMKVGRLRLTKPMLTLVLTSLMVFVMSGCYIYYNTNVINQYSNSDEIQDQQAKYEKELSQYEFLPQPKVTDVYLEVDVFPYQRDYEAEGYFILENQEDQAIKDVHIQLSNDFQINVESIAFEGGATLKEDLADFRYRIYELNKPLAPGQSLKMEFKQKFTTEGFVESNSNTSVVFNGTFFNSSHFPSMGYNSGFELASDSDRKEYDLLPKERLMERDDPKGLSMGILGDDSRGINFEIIVSTDSSQIAVAPGYLQKQWNEGNRAFYHYKMDQPMENFYNIVSADYEVIRDKTTIMRDSAEQEIKLEIYYHKGHEYNLDRMMKSMKQSFAYLSEEFSPYQYDQMRILEFPRYATFAQSFANTVPFSEAIGFVLEIDDEDDVDVAFYVTAHELAHQWWAHQVMSANVKGSQMIIESLAQYSALMIMKGEYRTELMNEFLKEEMNRYLGGRANEQKKEMSLSLVENQQYIHYGKGAVNMYALQDYISEDSVNMALKRFINDWDDFEKNGRYSTTTDLLKYLRDVTPDSLQYVVTDLFEKIILYENKVEEATYQKRSDDEFVVSLDLSSKKFEADSLGTTNDVTLSDWIDVGVYGVDENGKDKLLYLEKHKISENQTSVEIKVSEEPKKAGIDPLNKLIDRNPNDNVKNVSLEEAS
ncbi:MAG: M1 family aminopeptidase [Bacteroidota bacterium]